MFSCFYKHTYGFYNLSTNSFLWFTEGLSSFLQVSFSSSIPLDQRISSSLRGNVGNLVWLTAYSLHSKSLQGLGLWNSFSAPRPRNTAEVETVACGRRQTGKNPSSRASWSPRWYRGTCRRLGSSMFRNAAQRQLSTLRHIIVLENAKRKDANNLTVR